MPHYPGKLTRRQIESLGTGRHSDGNGLHLVVKPSGAKSWIVRLTIKGQRNSNGAPLRTDLGLGGLRYVSVQQAREMTIRYLGMARRGINPRDTAPEAVPTFEQMARIVHSERLPTWKNAKHASQFINTLRDYTFARIGNLQVNQIGQPEVLACLSPIWTQKHETAKRLAQRMKTVLDVAKSKGYRTGENPVTEIREAKVLPQVKAKPKHHAAMSWQEVPAFYAELQGRSAIAAKALMFTCLTGSRTSETLNAQWAEFDFDNAIWTVPAERMKTGTEHRVPLTGEMIAILEPLKEMASDYVFEGQKRHRPLSNMSMLMLLRRMKIENVTVHGFRSTFRDWASEAAQAPREIAEMSLSHNVGNTVERAYARSDLLDRRRALLERWAQYVTGKQGQIVRLTK